MSVKTAARWFEYNFFMRLTYGSLMDCLVRDLKIASLCIASKAFSKVHRGDRHVDPPFSACWIKQSVYHQRFFWCNGGVKNSQCCWSVTMRCTRRQLLEKQNGFVPPPTRKERPRNGQRSKYRGRRHNADAQRTVAIDQVTTVESASSIPMKLGLDQKSSAGGWIFTHNFRPDGKRTCRDAGRQ